MPRAGPGADAGRDSNHVLDCATQFHAYQIISDVDAEARITEFFLHARCKFGVFGCHSHSRGLSFSHFQRKGWAAERSQLRTEVAVTCYHFMDDLRHAQVSFVFNALGSAEEKHLRPQPLSHVLKTAAAVV